MSVGVVAAVAVSAAVLLWPRAAARVPRPVPRAVPRPGAEWLPRAAAECVPRPGAEWLPGADAECLPRPAPRSSAAAHTPRSVPRLGADGGAESRDGLGHTVGRTDAVGLAQPRRRTAAGTLAPGPPTRIAWPTSPIASNEPARPNLLARVGRLGRTGRWGRSAERIHREVLADAATVLDLVRAGLGAGLPPIRAVPLAVAQLGPGSRVGSALARSLHAGMPDWQEVADELGVAQLGAVAQAWRLSETGGVALGEVLDTSARLLRAEAERSARLSVLLAGPRATRQLLGGLPLGGLAIAAAFGVDPLRLYTATPASTWCLVLGLSLLALGQAWTRRLVAQVLR